LGDEPAELRVNLSVRGALDDWDLRPKHDRLSLTQSLFRDVSAARTVRAPPVS
jgi:hypothetical protein